MLPEGVSADICKTNNNDVVVGSKVNFCFFVIVVLRSVLLQLLPHFMFFKLKRMRLTRFERDNRWLHKSVDRPSRRCFPVAILQLL